MPEPRSLEEWAETIMICGPTLDPDYLRGLVIATLRAYGEQQVAEATEHFMEVERTIQAAFIDERDALLAVVKIGKKLDRKIDYDDPADIEKLFDEFEDALSHPIVQRLVKEE